MCNATGQERTVISKTAPTWRKGAVTCQGKIAALNIQTTIKISKSLNELFLGLKLNFKYESLTLQKSGSP